MMQASTVVSLSNLSVNDFFLTIQGFLEGNERFSKFYEWLKSGEIDKEFERDQKLTVWAVDNETFDMYHNFGEKDSLAIRYHVNNLSFAKSNLRDGLRIKTLCNIYLQININSKDEGDVISVNNVADVKEVYSTQNGTIYVLDNMLMPRVSIYDYLVTLDDRYSIKIGRAHV